MSSTKVAKQPVSFDIKSALITLESVIIRSSNASQVQEDLDARFAKHPDFFDNDPVIIDVTQLRAAEDPAQLDLSALCQLLKKHKMNPVALRSNSAVHHAWAELAGLFLISPSQMPAEPRRGAERQEPQAQPSPPPSPAPQSSVQAPSVQPPIVDSSIPSSLQVPSSPSITSALIVDKPLRSGQHVYAKGRDLIVTAMVNAGAEIMADGHIHVYAPLRGKAIAGAKGNRDARIYTSCLEAELISIAGVYRTSDAPLPAEVAGKSAHIRLIDDKLVMQTN